MNRHRPLAPAALAAVLALAACNSDDDGAEVRDLGATETTGEASAATASSSGTAEASSSGTAEASGSASGSGTAEASSSGTAEGSGSASGSGIAPGDLAQSTDDPLIQEAVEGYRAYLDEQVGILVADTTAFTDAVRAGDIEAAKEAYPISRQAWERIEPVAALIPDFDAAVDAREDDFSGPTDDDFGGWHRLEYQLWVEEDVSQSADVADQLDEDLADLAEAITELELPPGALTVGAQELIEEIASPDGKLSGEEDRYSGTDLYDLQANLTGSRVLVDLLAPAVVAADPELLTTIEDQFDDVQAGLDELGSVEAGYVHFSEVTDEQKDDLAADLSLLAESVSMLNGTLGLE